MRRLYSACLVILLWGTALCVMIHLYNTRTDEVKTVGTSSLLYTCVNVVNYSIDNKVMKVCKDFERIKLNTGQLRSK